MPFGIKDLDPVIMSCKLAPLQRMDLRVIKIWNQDLVSTWAEILDLSPNITNCYSLHVWLGLYKLLKNKSHGISNKCCLLTVQSTWCCSWRLHVVALLSDCHISTYVDDIKKVNEANQSSHNVLTDLQSLQSTSVGIKINSQLFFQTSLLLRKPLGI